jgi:predicted transglutaminase-like cysteine proteinase
LPTYLLTKIIACLTQFVLALMLVIAIATADHTGVSEKLFSKISATYGIATELRVRKWQEMIHYSEGLNDEQKLEQVNNFFNGARFVNDIEQWSIHDYWATPLEFIAQDAGDCEDFSIAKYFTLKEMGMDSSKLRITYVKALTLNQAHMVLAYYSTPSSVPVILDNINKRIKSATDRSDLQPVYSFNVDDLWLARSRNEQLKVGKPQQLNLWNDLSERMIKELL